MDVLYLGSICAAITTVINLIMMFAKPFKKPLERLAELEKQMMETLDEMKGKNRESDLFQRRQRDANAVVFGALMSIIDALIKQEPDNQSLADARDSLKQHLINY